MIVDGDMMRDHAGSLILGTTTLHSLSPSVLFLLLRLKHLLLRTGQYHKTTTTDMSQSSSVLVIAVSDFQPRVLT